MRRREASRRQAGAASAAPGRCLAASPRALQASLTPGRRQGGQQAGRATAERVGGGQASSAPANPTRSPMPPSFCSRRVSSLPPSHTHSPPPSSHTHAPSIGEAAPTAGTGPPAPPGRPWRRLCGKGREVQPTVNLCPRPTPRLLTHSLAFRPRTRVQTPPHLSPDEKRAAASAHAGAGGGSSAALEGGVEPPAAPAPPAHDDDAWGGAVM